MFRRSLLALAICSPLILSGTGCSATANKNDVLVKADANVLNSVSQLSPEKLFSSQQALINNTTFEQMLLVINDPSSTLAELDTALYYLRAHSYFADMEAITTPQAEQLTQGLAALMAKKNVDARTQEHIAVTIYRYYDNNERSELLATLLPALGLQLQELANSDSNQANDYALWETIRTYGLLLNTARKDADGSLNALLTQNNVIQPLLRFAGSDLSIRQQQDWPKANSYWALALYRLALPASETEQPTAAEKAIDDAVREIALADIKNRGKIAKTTYTLGFHVNTFAGQEACLAQDDICAIPKQEAVLPIEHHCSDSLFILSQDLNEQELAISCKKLTSQEGDFHQLLQTNMQPTANDFNEALRVIAFKNWSQYNAYGQLLFDIQTDNGGMYIEGTPSKPGNQATFFAFRQFWIAPEFAIWNLNHEYVHYLDGHFVKYGGFGHFPSKMVWWSEGLAEYIAKGDDNPSTLRVIKDNIEQAPDLETIFATEYKDGVDRTYKWSYMAVRFLAEHYQQDLIKLSQYLKTDYFEGYELLLKDLTAHQDQFASWLKVQVDNFEDAEQNKPKINKINRYAYRDYLMPEHLTINPQHQHF
ncbi:collagenase [Shewanella waksmanii]|uniref:collagenase n=1 Tax=Shewanella waksmanii TaxID=213783 RepID=UPI0037350D65